MPEETEKVSKDSNITVVKPNEMEIFMWRELWKEVHDERVEFNKHQRTTYPLVMGQCSPALIAQLEGTKGFVKVKANQDIVELLKMIKALCCCHDQNNNEIYSVVTS